MKNIISIFAIIVTLLIMSCAPKEIVITSPKAGDIWEIGSEQEITWEAPQSTEYVKIELWYNGEFDSDIDKTELNDGNYTWKVPELMQAGDYKIKIKDKDNTDLFDVTAETFKITHKRQINIDYPTPYEELQQDTTETIKWNVNGLVKVNNVDIELWKGNSLDSSIATSETNTESYDWTIPAGLTIDNDYKIKIKDSSDNTVADEVPITITEKMPVQFTAPISTTKWDSLGTTTYDIQWSTDQTYTNIDIDFVKVEDDGSETLINNINTGITYSTGSYSWDIEDNTPSNDIYRINMYDGTTLIGKSKKFTIFNSDIKGTWEGRPSGDGFHIEFYETDAVVREDDGQGGYNDLGEGRYSYDRENDMIYGEATKIAPSLIGQGEEGDDPINLPITFEVETDLGPVEITVNSVDTTTSFMLDPTAGDNGEGLVLAFLDQKGTGDTATLIGTWKQTFLMETNITTDLIGGNDTINMDNSQTYIFEETGNALTLEYIEPQEIPEEFQKSSTKAPGDTITETAEWSNIDAVNGTFDVINADTNNERLINGTYKYIVLNGALMISRPENEGETADDPQYIVKTQ